MLIDSALTAAPATFIHLTVPPAAPTIASVRLAALTITLIHPAVPPITPVTLTIATVSHAGPTAIHNPQLMKKKNTILLQICLQKQSAYSVLKKRTKFWQKINVEFVCEAKQPYNSLKCHVKSLVEKRKQYLVSLATDDKNLKINLIRVLDAWIEMVKEDKAKKQAKKKTAEELTEQECQDEGVRDDLML